MSSAHSMSIGTPLNWTVRKVTLGASLGHQMLALLMLSTIRYNNIYTYVYLHYLNLAQKCLAYTVYSVKSVTWCDHSSSAVNLCMANLVLRVSSLQINCSVYTSTLKHLYNT